MLQCWANSSSAYWFTLPLHAVVSWNRATVKTLSATPSPIWRGRRHQASSWLPLLSSWYILASPENICRSHRHWFTWFRDVLLALGLSQCPHEPCIFFGAPVAPCSPPCVWVFMWMISLSYFLVLNKVEHWFEAAVAEHFCWFNGANRRRYRPSEKLERKLEAGSWRLQFSGAENNHDMVQGWRWCTTASPNQTKLASCPPLWITAFHDQKFKVQLTMKVLFTDLLALFVVCC